MLFLRRNLLPVTLTGLIIALIGGYGIYQVLNEHMALWHWGRPVYEADYRTDIDDHRCVPMFADSANQPLKYPFVFGTQGFRIPESNFAWLPEPRPFGDGRCTFKIRSAGLDLDLFWGSSAVPLRPDDAPPGTMVRFRDGTISISDNRFAGPPVPFETRSFSARTNEETDYTLSIQTINGIVTVAVNNIPVLKVADPYPLPAAKAFVGIRAGRIPLSLSHAQLRPASPDATLGQFAIPEMLVWRGAVTEALKRYVAVAKETSDKAVSERALVRAMYLILYRMPEFSDPIVALDSIRSNIPPAAPQSVEDHYCMVKTELYWRNGDFADAFRMLRLVSDPVRCRATAQVLAGYQYDLPKEVRRTLNEFLEAGE